MTSQSLGAPAFAMTYSGARLSGIFQAARIFSDLNVAGSVTLAPVVLREFAPRVGLMLPKTRDPRALAQLSAATDFSYGSEGVRLTQVQAQLDDTKVNGSVAYVGEPRAFDFQLAIDTIDVDRYLSAGAGDEGAGDEGAAAERASGAAVPAAGAQSAKTAEAAKTTPAATATVQAAEAANAAEAAGGTDTSKGPDAEGTLTVGALHFSPLDFSAVKVTVASKEGVVHLFPAVAQIDGGTYSGNITLDRQAPIAALSLDEHLISVDMTRLLAGTAYKGKLSGRGNVNLKATARGGALPEFLQSLNGQFEANLAGGAIEGVDLAYEYGVAQALIKHSATPTPSNPKRTPFDAAHFSADITDGVAKTSDFTISTAVLKVTGQGSANLNNKAIDFKMLASVMQTGVSVADIPLKVTGTYADPKVRADVGSLAKGQLKQKLQDVLKKNGLNGLFGK
jgi:AsmA protein